MKYSRVNIAKSVVLFLCLFVSLYFIVEYEPSNHLLKAESLGVPKLQTNLLGSVRTFSIDVQEEDSKIVLYRGHNRIQFYHTNLSPDVDGFFESANELEVNWSEDGLIDDVLFSVKLTHSYEDTYRVAAYEDGSIKIHPYYVGESQRLKIFDDGEEFCLHGVIADEEKVHLLVTRMFDFTKTETSWYDLSNWQEQSNEPLQVSNIVKIPLHEDDLYNTLKQYEGISSVKGCGMYLMLNGSSDEASHYVTAWNSPDTILTYHPLSSELRVFNPGKRIIDIEFNHESLYALGAGYQTSGPSGISRWQNIYEWNFSEFMYVYG